MNFLIFVLLFILILLKKYNIQENYTNWTESKINTILNSSIAGNVIIIVIYIFILFNFADNINNIIIGLYSIFYTILLIIPICIHFLKYNYTLTKPPLLIILFIKPQVNQRSNM